MADFCHGCGQYVGQGCECDTKYEKELLNTIKALEDTIKFKDEQIHRELADNNGLREVVGIQRNIIQSIKTLQEGDRKYCPNREDGKICDVCTYRDKIDVLLGDI